MLWQSYVFRRDKAVHALWDDLFKNRDAELLFIAGCGFDTRVIDVLREFREAATRGRYQFSKAALLLVELDGYELDEELVAQTKQNCDELRATFEIGSVSSIRLQLTGEGAEFRAVHAIQKGAQAVVEQISDCTDVILDVSSLPRIVFLSLMTALLDRIIRDKSVPEALHGAGINFQILVAEDSTLDSKIQSEDPSEDLVLIPGFGGGIKVESMARWPVVWFPILGEGRVAQFEKVMSLAEIPGDAEICPVVPHPSRSPRRGDNLLLEYRAALFDRRDIPFSNVLYAHESNPFEAYRQLRGAIESYTESLRFLGGSRVLITPFSSKLMTIAAGLAAFELKPVAGKQDYAIGMPYAAPTRYTARRSDLAASKAVLTSLLLTGTAYAPM